MQRLYDKVAIVTGGARGIGKAISMTLAQEGANTIINYSRSVREAEEVAQEIEQQGGKAFPMRADVTDALQVNRMVDEVVRQHRRIDILVNNAGIVRDKLLLSMKDTDWDDVIRVNLRSVYLCTKAVTKYMTLQKAGKVINLSSVAADMGGRGRANYASSKGAINAFTKSMAIELAPKGITVNAVAPGVINTDMTLKVRKLGSEQILDKIPLRRFGQPEDVASVVAFLASVDADYVTGEIVHVTGGMGV